MMKFKLGIGLKLGIASAILILLSAGVIVSRQVAMSGISNASDEARTQARIFDQLQGTSLLLSRIRVNAAEMRLSYASLDNADLLKQVDADIASAKTKLDETMAIEAHLSCHNPLKPSSPLPWNDCYLSCFFFATLRSPTTFTTEPIKPRWQFDREDRGRKHRFLSADVEKQN